MAQRYSYGQPYRTVCWLIQLSVYDCYMPEDHTLEYAFCEPYEGYGSPPRPFFLTFDREEAERFGRAMYASQTRFSFHTRWRDPNGHIAKKLPIVRRWKDEHEGRGQGDTQDLFSDVTS